VVERAILDKIDAWTKKGGRLILLNNNRPMRDVEDRAWSPVKPIVAPLDSLASQLKDCKGYDGERDGLWTCRRGGTRGAEVFIYNTTDKPARRSVTVGGKTLEALIEPHAIWISP